MAANMKAVKLRIKSVESTMQITKAMELVASSKLRKAKERADTCRPYFQELYRTLQDIAKGNTEFYSIYAKEAKNEKCCYVLVAGDRGLAGGYNANLFRCFEADELGYNITFKVVNCANYGVPQTRKRFFCIGVKKELPEFVFPEETHADPDKNSEKKPWITCGEVIGDFDFITDEEKEQRPGAKDYDLLCEIPAGDNYLYFTEKRGYPNPKFKWKSRYWTFLLKLTPDRPSWTIQASFSTNQGPFHWRNRFLRIEELKRIQTIPDEYELCGDFKEQWRQVGNAVPSDMAYVIASAIKEAYFNGR